MKKVLLLMLAVITLAAATGIAQYYPEDKENYTYEEVRINRAIAAQEAVDKAQNEVGTVIDAIRQSQALVEEQGLPNEPIVWFLAIWAILASAALGYIKKRNL